MPDARIHILSGGFPLCGFSARIPGEWPPGNVWCRPEDVDHLVMSESLHCKLCCKLCFRLVGRKSEQTP